MDQPMDQPNGTAALRKTLEHQLPHLVETRTQDGAMSPSVDLDGLSWPSNVAIFIIVSFFFYVI
jgi:hypothetical protein